MRKDSQIFLKKILDYRNSTGENNFELNYSKRKILLHYS